MRFKNEHKYSEITPKSVFLNRRAFLGSGAALAATGGMAKAAVPFGDGESPNSLNDIRSYNNFYEFGTGKDDPSRYAAALTTSPWSIKVDGMVDRPGVYALDDLLSGLDVHDRIYRFRCVEAWSMIIPWNGIQMSDILKKVGVKRGAKYVAFETLNRPSEMRGQKSNFIDWPYREGLRLDEAMNPLTMMATGIYDEPMANQNGAPIRLVVPWKYGYKSIKSVVKITLTNRVPQTTWNMLQPNEYGFYSNVNPKVDHPRWSQASERRVGGGLFAKRVPTLMFNGYADEVARLYAGMDLVKNH